MQVCRVRGLWQGSILWQELHQGLLGLKQGELRSSALECMEERNVIGPSSPQPHKPSSLTDALGL